VSKVSPARLIACDAFVEVMENKKKPDDVLDAFYRDFKGDMKRIDKNLAKEILYGGLRWYKKILWILQHTSNRDLMKLSPQVRATLVLATYQIYYMDRIPERAAVNEAAEYMKAKKQLGAVGFVNGILRQIARRAAYFTKPDKKKQPIEYLALQFSHPEWLVQRWMDRFGFEKMEVMLAANNQPPPIFVRMNSLMTPPQEAQLFQDRLLRDEHMHSDKGSLKGCYSLKKFPDLSPESLFGRGLYTIQDQASQLIAHLVEYKDGMTILDAAAGPGGKLTHMVELSQGKSKIIAVEKSDSQMKRAVETATRLKCADKIHWIEKDFAEVTAPADISKEIDVVLLDAPCTGLGVLRRHPEGKWHKDLTGITQLSEMQRALLMHAFSLLKVGGEIIYSVCSFEPEETIDHLNWLQKKHSDSVEIVSPVSRLPDYFKRYVTRDNILLIYAGNQDDMDGFGAFIIRKKGELR
jgi:16S rRNA (cytosine967-C5)-methyltransferase